MKKYFQAPWSLKDLIFIFSSTLGLIGATLLIIHFLDIKTSIEASEYRSFYLLGLFLIQWILIALPLIIFTLIKHGFKWEYFGFQKIEIWKIIKLILGGYLLYIGITFLITLIILYTDLKIPGYQVQEKILPLFGDSLTSLIVAGVIIIAIAPPLEEIFFRGFLLRCFSNRWGIFNGSVLSAGIFAIFHLQWQSIIPIFILGLIINSLVIKGKSLWPAIFFHAFNNAIAFTVEILILKEVISMENIV